MKIVQGTLPGYALYWYEEKSFVVKTCWNPSIYV